jgi:hypothetical protein
LYLSPNVNRKDSGGFISYKSFLILILLISPVRSQMPLESLINSLPYGDETDGEGTPRCGFHILLEAYRLDQKQATRIMHESKLEVIDKVYDSILSPSGHFLINYETEGSSAIPTYDRDQNGTPDYLEFVAKSFDRAWEVEIDSLGFRPPPDEVGSPRETYEIFCKRFSSLYGSTYFFLEDEILSLPGNNYPSYIEISTNFSFVNYEGVTDSTVRDSMAIAVTAAHEFNHALQLGYNIWDANPSPSGFEALDLWYIENSAVFMEEVVADEVNDYYQYLPDFYSSTDQGITRDPFSSLRIYGEVILNIMAAKLYGNSITREVWQEIIGEPALSALDRVFDRKGSSFDRELQRLSEWMFFSGDYSIPGAYFVEAVNYPQPKFRLSDDFYGGIQQISENKLPPFSIQYVKSAVSSNSNLNIYLAPKNIPDEWSGMSFSLQQPFSEGFPAKVYSHILHSSVQSNNDSVFAAVVAGNWNGGSTDSLIQYSLSLREYSGDPEARILVYPTVIKPEQGVEYITFKNVEPDSRIEIFSSAGKHVATVRPQLFGNDNIYWNLQTSEGDVVGSGVYIYSIVSPTISQKGKIIVIQ